MESNRKELVRRGLLRWSLWVETNKHKSSRQSSLGGLYQESLASKGIDYHYQPFNYECSNCGKQFLKLPLDKNDKPQQRCVRCGYRLVKVSEGITGKKVFAGLIHETGKNIHDPVAEIYNAAVKSLPKTEYEAVLWKYLSHEDQKTYADNLEISVPQLQQALIRAYYYIMGYLDAQGER